RDFRLVVAEWHCRDQGHRCPGHQAGRHADADSSASSDGLDDTRAIAHAGPARDGYATGQWDTSAHWHARSGGNADRRARALANGHSHDDTRSTDFGDAGADRASDLTHA